jgi:hypothetical protein
VGYLVGTVALVLGVWSGNLGPSIPFFLVAGIAIAEPNPPLDAARLDIIASGVWGRAESVRTVVRGVFESSAPLLFGIVSSTLAGTSRPGWNAGVNASHVAFSTQQAAALRNTFLIVVVALGSAGLIILRARRHYPIDVLTAGEYEARSAEPSERP